MYTIRTHLIGRWQVGLILVAAVLVLAGCGGSSSLEGRLRTDISTTLNKRLARAGSAARVARVRCVDRGGGSYVCLATGSPGLSMTVNASCDDHGCYWKPES